MIESVRCALDANIILHPFDVPHISINIGFAPPPWRRSISASVWQQCRFAGQAWFVCPVCKACRGCESAIWNSWSDRLPAVDSQDGRYFVWVGARALDGSMGSGLAAGSALESAIRNGWDNGLPGVVDSWDGFLCLVRSWMAAWYWVWRHGVP